MDQRLRLRVPMTLEKGIGLASAQHKPVRMSSHSVGATESHHSRKLLYISRRKSGVTRTQVTTKNDPPENS